MRALKCTLSTLFIGAAISFSAVACESKDSDFSSLLATDIQNELNVTRDQIMSQTKRDITAQSDELFHEYLSTRLVAENSLSTLNVDNDA